MYLHFLFFGVYIQALDSHQQVATGFDENDGTEYEDFIFYLLTVQG